MTPRFQVRAIRPWSRIRRNHKARTSGSIGSVPESSGNMPCLEEILSAYDHRVAAETVEREGHTERQERFQRGAAQILDAVIAPALEGIGEEIVAHGHRWDIEPRVDILGQPALACTFAPKISTSQEGNELSFRFHFPDRLSITPATKGASELRDLPARSYQLADLSPELIQSEVTRFVSRVLAES